MVFTYFLQALDKGTLSFASIMVCYLPGSTCFLSKAGACNFEYFGACVIILRGFDDVGLNILPQ